MADPPPNWDKALDELAGPHHPLIPLLAKIAYNREMGAPVNTKLGLVNRLIEGLESGQFGRGALRGFMPLYQRLLNKEGELRLDKYKGVPDPIAEASRNRAELANYQAVPPAPPPPPQPEVGRSWNPWQSMTTLKPYTDEQGNTLGFSTAYQRQLMKEMAAQGKTYSPLLWPVEKEKLIRPLPSQSVPR